MVLEPHLGQHPVLLSPGTQVGAWRVVGWAGRGVYGAVYRAVPVGDDLAQEAALKIALLPEDPRFVHEAELIGRMNHPSIPRLLDHGQWQSPGGIRHPFLVMERVERPEERGPTAQLAEELEQAAELAEVSASVPQQGPAQVPRAEGAAGVGGVAESLTPRAHVRRVRPWLALAAVGLALAVWILRARPSPPVEESSVAEAGAGREGAPEADPTGLGEAAAAATSLEERRSSLQEAMVEHTPPEPLPGQTRPDVKGRCPHKGQVALNRGCWLELALEPERCFELKG
jgi:hypothetical protein